MNKPSRLKMGAVLIVFTFLLVGCGAVGREARGFSPLVKPQMPSGQGAVWDLVVIGDSSLWAHGEAIASQITRDVGVEVILHDFALPALRAGTVLEVLQTGKSSNFTLEKLPGVLKEAEVVVMFTNPRGSVDPDKPLDFESCFLAGPPRECGEQAFAQYSADLEAIWAKIIELRDGQPTILRATDIYNPLVEFWKKNDVFEGCDVCWVNMSMAARKAAEAHHIPFVSRYDAFNGADHREDPVSKGFISGDGEHPSPEGAAFAAQILFEAGYDPTIP